MEVIFLISGLIAFAISIFFAYRNRYNASKSIASVTLGILFATFIMVLPTEWIPEGKVLESPILYSTLSSLFYSFEALGGKQDIAQLETIALSGILKTIYIYANYLMSALAPILASGFVLSFIGDFGEKIRYFFSWTPKHYIFSEINVNSVELAKGIKNTSHRKTLVFCKGKDADKDLLEEAKKLGGIVLHKSCKNLKLLFKNYEFYFINENEDENIELTEDIISKKEKLKKHNIFVNTFAQSGTNIQVIESMISKKPCAIFESTHEVLINKAIEIIDTAPDTKIVFFNVSEADNKFAFFKEKYSHELEEHNFEIYPSDWKVTKLDDKFKAYNITLYYPHEKINDKDETETVAVRQDLGCNNKNHLVTTWQDEPLKIRFVDEIALFCNNLIFNHPLYDLPNGRRDISVLIVGCDRLGTQMLKTVVWCGQIEGYTLKIRVLDKKATSIEKEFYSRFPEMNNYGIKFENVDFESAAFEDKIKECSDATFVCVATGSDELNISTAENIYRILRRNYTGYTPPIFTRIRKIIKSKNFEKKGFFLYDRNIHLFGTTSSIFSNETLFNSQLENLAFAVHLCYNWALDKPKSSFEYQKALYDFYTSEYSRRSSMAAALHIPSKLKFMENTISSQNKNYDFEGIAKDIPDERTLACFEEFIKDKSNEQALMQNEHERWNAFMRSEGFRSVDFETVKKYAPYTRSHKDETAKLHPCITSWANLDTLQEQYNRLQEQLNLKKSNFKEYDKKLVVEIPKIFKKAEELSKEGW